MAMGMGMAIAWPWIVAMAMAMAMAMPIPVVLSTMFYLSACKVGRSHSSGERYVVVLQ